MAKTVGDVITAARGILQDRNAQLYRYATADLYTYLNDALLEMRRARPDLFFDFIGLDTPEFASGDELLDFPVSTLFFTPTVFYVAGRAELRDDEFTVDARAVTLMQQFTTKLLTVA